MPGAMLDWNPSPSGKVQSNPPKVSDMARLRMGILTPLGLCLVMTACAAPQANGTARDGSPVATQSLPASAAPTSTTMPSEGPLPGFVVLESGDLALYAGTVYVREVEELTINVVFFEEPEGPAFSPTIINATPGQRLNITFRDLDAHDREGIPPHDFRVTVLDLTVPIPPGGEASVELTMPESGTLQFYCRPHFINYHMAGEFRIN